MKLLSNRKFAWLILAICVVVSIVGLGGGSLAAQRRDVLDVFNDGIDDSLAVRFSMDAYLENCASYANIMAEEYRLRVDMEDALAGKILEMSAMLADSDDLDERYTIYVTLTRNVESLYTQFFSTISPEDDHAEFSHAYQNYQGEVSKISYDEYHALAEKFNDSLEGFPANLIAGLLGIDELNPF